MYIASHSLYKFTTGITDGCQCFSVVDTMKLTLTLFAVLAIIGLGQTHQVPNFGSGPLHEDIQDVLDLIPMEEVAEVFLSYLAEDNEFKEFLQRLSSSNVLKDLMVDVEAVPEVINLFNFLQKEGIEIYTIINAINKVFGIKELIPPASYTYPLKPIKRTGGVHGFFKDIKILFNYDDFIRIYVQKMQTSKAFVRFIGQLKSNNFQQIVNKVYSAKSFQLILNSLKQYGVKTQIVADIIYIVLGITVPKHPLPFAFERSLIDEIGDFTKIMPVNKFVEITVKYLTNDQKVQNAFAYVMNPEFHTLLHDVEVLKEHQALIVHLEKSGLHVIDVIQEFHRIIGMDKYVPPNIENRFESQIGVQEVGEGLRAMLDELVAVAPIKELHALYDEKMKTVNAFSDFVKKVTSPKMKELVFNLYNHAAYRKLTAKCLEQGLDLKALSQFYKKLIPIPIETPVF
ncbi:uncharacterized protein LOC116850061 [Odontomachus brunneus]|uniref:uncharacterized protein LOC116850061 n=1 Tax=Odontomachus brunneus TaxID=486640 RepID=UPI0013F20F0D|nr:uncharacterized protein LOC116850061 [Odontomachus brunneus]